VDLGDVNQRGDPDADHVNQVRQLVVWRRPAYEVLRENDSKFQFDWTPVTDPVALAHHGELAITER